MLKLYGQKDYSDKSTIFEITENTFQINGYCFASSLEDVMFNVTFNDKLILNVEVDENNEDYFSDFNTVKFLAVAKEYVQTRILDKGGAEVQINTKLKIKYGVNEAFIIDDKKI